ncbi:MAG: MipA/OmpV family protein [Hydrogenophaga sp.]|uniref:MipA/OmpV family protein n=1 Tax=Hydrogenophaga sp. TaxID=1904254 RepID=UPI002AB9EE23|nr:MipA/OmpV family protein [Hydrogenophaga sp.]MDZ4189604.1 MipA/OmpV family protein [Hydrogenophaga sp.]
MRTVAQQVALVGLLIFAFESAMAQASPNEGKLGLSGSIGLGVASMPSYEGSSNRRTLAIPYFTMNYRTRDWGEVSVGQYGLVWQAVEAGDLRMGLVVNPDAGRMARQPSKLNPRPGDKRLAGMGEVRESTEAGVLVGYGPFSLLARKSLGDSGHKGTQVDMSVAWPLKVSDKVDVSFGAGLTWADKDYMQTYFGVTPAQSLASGFRAYTPKAGVRKFELSANAEYALAKDWKLQGSLALTQLTGDAADSSLVARKSNPSMSLGIAYVF